jgi:hypothetical protein
MLNTSDDANRCRWFSGTARRLTPAPTHVVAYFRSFAHVLDDIEGALAHVFDHLVGVSSCPLERPPD